MHSPASTERCLIVLAGLRPPEAASARHRAPDTEVIIGQEH